MRIYIHLISLFSRYRELKWVYQSNYSSTSTLLELN